MGKGMGCGVRLWLIDALKEVGFSGKFIAGTRTIHAFLGTRARRKIEKVIKPRPEREVNYMNKYTIINRSPTAAGIG